ncbi:MAG: RNA polymerase sigma factor [Myxococcota bacterium]
MPATSLTETVAEAVRAYCPTWLRSDCDDISQTASLRVVLCMRQRPDLRPTAAYLRRAARNAVIDTVRRCDARERWRHAAACIPRDAERNPEQLALDRELARTLQQHLARLPEDRRDAVALYVQGCRPSEIADRFACGTKRVENLLYRGLRSLRKSLADEGMHGVHRNGSLSHHPSVGGLTGYA